MLPGNIKPTTFRNDAPQLAWQGTAWCLLAGVSVVAHRVATESPTDASPGDARWFKLHNLSAPSLPCHSPSCLTLLPLVAAPFPLLRPIPGTWAFPCRPGGDDGGLHPTSVMVRDGRYQLVRDRGRNHYSLPGGGKERSPYP